MITTIILAVSILVAAFIIVWAMNGRMARVSQAADERHTLMMNEQRQAYERQINELTRRLESQQREMREVASSEFKALAAEALRTNSSALTDANSQQINALLQPLKIRIEDFQRSFRENAEREIASTAALERHISLLAQQSEKVSEEADRLAKALKSDSQKQGAFGETILKNLLENSGLVQGVNYWYQPTEINGKKILDESNRSFRPDFIISIGGGRNLVIDSKTSLTAYTDYVNAASSEEQNRTGKSHIVSVKNHIKELAAKKYHKLVPGSANFVLLFIPNEGAYYAALRLDPTLCSFAYDNNIALTGPTHILSIVPLIMQIWKTEEQNRSVREIAEKAGDLHDRLVSFTQDFDKIETSLNATKNAIEKARHTLSGSNQSVVAKAVRLEQLGAKTGAKFPASHKADLND